MYEPLIVGVMLIVAVLLIQAGPHIWSFFVRFGSRNVRSEGERIRALERDFQGEIEPSNQEISQDEIESQDAADTAESILEHIREEWAKQNRR